MAFYSGVSLARERPADYFTGRENSRVFSAELTASPNSTKCFVFVNPKTKSGLQETKTAFQTACRLAGIQGLIWKDLWAKHSQLDWPKPVVTPSRSHNYWDSRMFG